MQGGWGYPVDNLSFYCVWRARGGRPVFTCVVVDAETSQEKFTHYFHIYFVCIFIEGNEWGQGNTELGENAWRKYLTKYAALV